MLARYEVLCPIGSGGMATVHAARILGEESFQKLVALKVMLPHLASDEKFVRMFVDEARVAAQVQSSHVVATLDLGRVPERGILFQVLELVLGASLRQLLDAQAERRRPMDLDVALAILVQAARGLADAHAARSLTGAPLRLVHRDVSPHNVLVGIDGRARLSDFGVARAAARATQTESGELKGKVAYAAPEQLRGEPAEPASDVFALGVVAWETLAGRRLFEADNPLAIVDQMLRRPIPSLRDARPDLPEAIVEIVTAALERERGTRLGSAAELADRLERAAAEHGGLAGPARIAEVVRDLAGERLAAVERTIAERLAEPAVPSPASRERQERRGRAVRIAALSAALAIAAAWTAASALSERAPEDAASTRAAPPEERAAAPITEPPRAIEDDTTAADAEPHRDAGLPAVPRTITRRGTRTAERATEPEPEAAPSEPPAASPEPAPVTPRTPLLGLDAFDREEAERAP
ncbi:serine/threonine protein kinase [Sandaracinus amylolyticus]|uniref:Serine/threonine protein kinase n=1 Tax=Sandaracinus amylolyticus TaxID=927083 RepID=A0A0F6W0Y7_9BACT|nr:serine/threonine protein kinase [Sandaracinus amylolyticus]